MIIDSHSHLFHGEWCSGEIHQGFARFAAAQFGKVTGVYPDTGTLTDQLLLSLTDTTGENKVTKMDTAQVAMACIFTFDSGLATSAEPKVSIEDQNRMVAAAARRFPDRLIPFFAVDPRRPNGLQMFERGVREEKMRGLKLYPPTGFFPQDTVCYPYYRKCVEYGIPVLFHSASAMAPLKARFARPICIDDVAADFPDLSIIVAHAGGMWWEEGLGVASSKPNVYLDLSGWQSVLNRTPSQFYAHLRRMMDTVGPWKLFFGTDSPIVDWLLPLDRWVKAFEEPDLSSCPDIKFAKEEMAIVLGKAFARLMRLE